MTHICVSKLTIIASDNGLSPGRRKAIIWNNAGILSIWLLGTYFSEILIEILTFSFKKMRLKVLSAKRRPFCLGLNVFNHVIRRGHCRKWQECSTNRMYNCWCWEVSRLNIQSLSSNVVVQSSNYPAIGASKQDTIMLWSLLSNHFAFQWE